MRATEKNWKKNEVTWRSVKRQGGHEVVPAKVSMTGAMRKELGSDNPNDPSPWEAKPGRCQSRPSCLGESRTEHCTKLKWDHSFCVPMYLLSWRQAPRGMWPEDRWSLSLWSLVCVQGRPSLWDRLHVCPSAECLHVVTHVCPAAGSRQSFTCVQVEAPLCSYSLWGRCRLWLCGFMP